jgi:hypothetical protein
MQDPRGKLPGFADAKVNEIINEVSDPSVNMDMVKLEKAPKMAVYSPKTNSLG